MTGTNQDGSLSGRLPAGLASIAFVVATSGFALVSQTAPQALPADAPADVFSAARAMRHVQAIAREPHPLGSPSEEPVRNYVIGELKALSLQPEVQQPYDSRSVG